MSNEKQKDKALKPSSIFVPIDWGTHVTCSDCGEKYERGIANVLSHMVVCTHQFTEDIEHELIKPKQLPNGK